MYMTKSLEELAASGLPEEDRYDIILSLCLAVDQGKNLASPEEIEADDKLVLKLPRNPENMMYYPPETIQSMIRGTEAPVGVKQNLFMLGMLCYYLFTGENYYTHAGIDVLEIGPALEKKTSVFDSRDARALPFGKALALLMAVNPDERREGMKELLTFFREKVPGTAVFIYQESGRTVKMVEHSLRQDLEDPAPVLQADVRDVGYRVVSMPGSIPYRPGKRRYVIDVRKDETAATETEAERLPQAGPSGRWLYAKTELLTGAAPAHGEEEYKAILSLGRRDAAYMLYLARGAADGEFLVVSKGSGGDSFITQRFRFPLKYPAGTIRLVYRQAEQKIQMEYRKEDGSFLGREELNLEDKG